MVILTHSIIFHVTLDVKEFPVSQSLSLFLCLTVEIWHEWASWGNTFSSMTEQDNGFSVLHLHIHTLRRLLSVTCKIPCWLEGMRTWIFLLNICLFPEGHECTTSCSASGRGDITIPSHKAMIEDSPDRVTSQPAATGLLLCSRSLQNEVTV